MSTEQNKQIIRRFFEELFNEHRTELIDEFLATDYALYHPGSPDPLGRDAFPDFLQGFYTGFADFHMSVEAIIAEGDEVAARFVLTGTHHGPFMGVEATGKKVVLPGEAFYKMLDGKILEDRPLIDWATMLEQMDVL